MYASNHIPQSHSKTSFSQHAEASPHSYKHAVSSIFSPCFHPPLTLHEPEASPEASPVFSCMLEASPGLWKPGASPVFFWKPEASPVFFWVPGVSSISYQHAEASLFASQRLALRHLRCRQRPFFRFWHAYLGFCLSTLRAWGSLIARCSAAETRAFALWIWYRQPCPQVHLQMHCYCSCHCLMSPF